MRRFLRSLPLLLAAGIGGTVLIACGSLALVDLGAITPTENVQSYDGHVQWNIGMAYAPATVRLSVQRSMGLSWCVDQACGPPNARAGDDPAAWASDPADGTAEWLELEYDASVVPTAVWIYENFNPGAVVKVTIFDDATRESEIVYRGNAQVVSPTPASVRKLELPIQTSRRTRRVRLDVDSAAVPGWNEIDAVGLVDSSGTVGWAVKGRASTTYRGGKDGDDVTRLLVPAWARVPMPSARTVSKPTHQLQQTQTSYAIEGRGWPMAAMRVEIPDPAIPHVRVIRPIWLGVIVDAILLAAVFALVKWLAVYPKRFIVESNRLRRGRCMQCGYELQYNFPAGCPECGWRRGPAMKQEEATP